MNNQNSIQIIRRISLGIFFFLYIGFSYSQPQTDFFKAEREKWLEKAMTNLPELIHQQKEPKQIVNLVKDADAFQGYRVERKSNLDSLYQNSFKKVKTVVVDFGEHLTGYCTIKFRTLQGTSDAPTRFRFTFGEVPAEIEADYSNYNGLLSKGWLQDEIINVESIPAEITLPRRCSGRYLKIELLGASPWFDFAITNISLDATTSATTSVNKLNPSVPKLTQQLDSIGLTTLKECMQTVFEDGPKRDQRLWIGDFYLQSLANNFSFNNQQLSRRCFYLLAAFSDLDGYLPSNVFERPTPHAQSSAHIIDYSLLYAAALKEYVAFTQDKETGLDLWPIAIRQINYLSQYIKPNGEFDYAQASKNGGSFFDWHPDLDKHTATQATFIFAAKEALALAYILGKKEEAMNLNIIINKMTKYLLENSRDPQTSLFVSGKNKQISYASQVWAVLAGIVPQKEAQKILKAVQNHPNAVKPVTPYLYHYFIQALINAKMDKDARKVLDTYWGSMVAKGADTFWEVNDTKNEKASPYDYYPVNSYCHAWSCTPVYFIRKYPQIFQKRK